MKRLFIALMLISSAAHAKQIVLDIPTTDIAIVENDVLDAEQWIRDAWAGKLSKCKSRMVQEEIKASIDKNETLPAGEDAIIQKHLRRPDYKNRKQRDAN